MKDLYHNLSVTQVTAPATLTATTTSSAIDLRGFASACVVFTVGASGDTLSGSVYWTLSLTESDDNSSYTAVTSGDIASGSASIVIDSGSEDDQAYVMGYTGSKRYVKAVITKTGTHTNGTPFCVVALKGHASLQPVN